MDLCKKILELRKKEGFSQEQLAEKLKVTRQTISNWELGQTKPDISQANELARIFNITLDELVGNNIEDVLLNRTATLEKKYNTLADIIKLIAVVFIAFCLIVVIPLFIEIIF